MVTLMDRFWGYDNEFTSGWVPGLIDDVWTEAKSAIGKHGFDHTPANPNMSIHEKLTILVEEVGEVARACTYDEGSSEQRVAELIQVATMALMWAAAERELGE